MNNDKKLRSDLIRLAASSTPEVRKALLPLLGKKAGVDDGEDYPSAEKAYKAVFQIHRRIKGLIPEIRAALPLLKQEASEMAADGYEPDEIDALIISKSLRSVLKPLEAFADAATSRQAPGTFIDYFDR